MSKEPIKIPSSGLITEMPVDDLVRDSLVFYQGINFFSLSIKIYESKECHITGERVDTAIDTVACSGKVRSTPRYLSFSFQKSKIVIT